MSKNSRVRANARQDERNIQWRGGIAYGRIEVNGKELRRSLRTKDPAEARGRLKEWKDEVMAAAGLAEHRHSWMEAVGRYLLEVGPGAVKPDVLKRYECSLTQVHPWLGNLRVDQITRRIIADMVGGRKRQGVTNATVNRDLTAVSRVLAATVMWGWREDNPARTFDRGTMTRERRDPIVLPKAEHVDSMIAASPPMFAGLLKVLRYTGLREEEGSSLEWGQVALRGNRTAIDLVRTKTDRPRSIPLDDILTAEAKRVLEELPRYLHKRPAGAEAKPDYVFWHDEGELYSSASSNFGSIRRRLNVKRKKAGKEQITFRLHDLRHLFAVSYLRGGGNIYRLQKLLGHKSIKTTELYLDYLTPEEAMVAQFGDGASAGGVLRRSAQ
jgi:site-specific recombinase XerD